MGTWWWVGLWMNWGLGCHHPQHPASVLVSDRYHDKILQQSNLGDNGLISAPSSRSSPSRLRKTNAPSTLPQKLEDGNECLQLPLSRLSHTLKLLPRRMVQPTIKINLPKSISIMKVISHRHTQRPFFQETPDSFKLTITHHSSH